MQKIWFGLVSGVQNKREVDENESQRPLDVLFLDCLRYVATGPIKGRVVHVGGRFSLWLDVQNIQRL